VQFSKKSLKPFHHTYVKPATIKNKFMRSNIGKPDKIIRLIAGILIGTAGICNGSWWGLVGIIPILTALINWCPVYVPFGISSCKKKSS